MTSTSTKPLLAADADGAGATTQEIAQQPRLWRELAQQAADDRETTDFLAPVLSRPDLRIVLTGAGTSAFGGEILAPALRRATGRRVDAVATTDVVSDPYGAFAEDVPTLLVSFARSGDSPESVAATALADRLLTDVHHLLVTCNPDGALARDHGQRVSSRVLLMPEGANDRGFAMTSSLTCMTLAVLLALGRVDRADVERLASAVEVALPTLELDAASHADLDPVARVVHLGSGPLTGLARESALKLLELTAGRVATFFDSALGFRHGPKALLDDSTLVVVHVSTDPYTRAYDLDIVTELTGALPAGRLVVVSAERLPLDAEQWTFPSLAGDRDELVALAYVVASQVLALRTSLALGLTPDDPFPSGEVNRVVAGVTIHALDA
ncbi:SIS domain-containing protein [Solicola sp. PLA-1-18]|uniref:SIS domain-containing protein n=1 Tax=Solicola sp. PLA-1-18 TaxID=3380532 RepID=UPI003B79E7CF